MHRIVILHRLLLVFPGTLLLLASLLTLNASLFGSPQFTGGLALHLFGLLLCVSSTRVGLPSPRARRWPESEHQAQGEFRPATFRATTQGLRFAASFACLCLLSVGVGLTVNRAAQLVMLARRGRVVEAQITGRESRMPASTSGLVTYAYRVGRREYTGDFRAPYSVYRSMMTGNYVRLTYLPASPSLHFLGVLDAHTLTAQLFALALLLTIGVVYVGGPLVWLETRLRRELHLARHGVSVTGVILGCKPIALRGRLFGYLVGYEFAMPPGLRLRGSAFVRPTTGEPTLVGFPVLLLCDAVNPLVHRPVATLTHVRMSATSRRVMAV